MRDEFQGQLQELGELLTAMADKAARQMRLATTALLDHDLHIAEAVLADDAELDADRDRCAHDAQRVLALQAPVASDLREVIAVVHCAERIERMGDLARHVAEVARRTFPQPAVPAVLTEEFAELGELDAAMAERLSELIRTREHTEFDQLVRVDEKVDALHRTLMTEVTSPDWSHGVPAAVNVALLARFYERFADQVVSVAKRIDFALTGVPSN
ncbi:MAG TPA: phosphate signaling complex protein PhoU [Pseudonocardiaceae bacterium]|jgi:phosphate transport system protein|nr:phosphate signaling complex protein PhoU [Pseudonocardiaceae bacterium]